MSVSKSKSNRHILPRWRSSFVENGSRELVALKKPNTLIKEDRSHAVEAKHDFELEPSIGRAADILAMSISHESPELVERASRFIMEHEDEAPPLLFAFVKEKITGHQERSAQPDENQHPPYKQSVSQTRSQLRINPQNPLLWSDLGRHFATLGKKREAKRCMQIALGQAPNHRKMLRMMSRFLAHAGEHEEAHKLLAKHPLTKRDPWLMAAELACSQIAARKPTSWSKANDIIKNKLVSPQHMTELATAVAMMELEVGNNKRAKKLVKAGLVNPTENTLAQVFWAQENKHLQDGFHLESLVRHTNKAYEAEFQMMMSEGRLLDALKAAKEWDDDEPFAARPKFEIAYIASLIDQLDVTLEMGRLVKQIDGDLDPVLEMNCIYATLSIGEVFTAPDLVKIHDRIVQLQEQSKDTSYQALANLGLFHYRYGDRGLGRRYYQEALSLALSGKLYDQAAMASVFFARESILAGDEDAKQVLTETHLLVDKARNKIGEFYLRKLQDLIMNPQNAEEILSPRTAKKYLEDNTQLTQRQLLNRMGDKKFVLPARMKSLNFDQIQGLPIIFDEDKSK